jgi:hypothetical protein
VPSCPTGEALCSGACQNLQINRNHCGACGVVCRAGEPCIAGRCVFDCAIGLTPCAGTCVDLNTDRAHCTACGAACATGQVCVGGACVAR